MNVLLGAAAAELPVPDTDMGSDTGCAKDGNLPRPYLLMFGSRKPPPRCWRPNPLGNGKRDLV
jgi:hypothetical protein